MKNILIVAALAASLAACQKPEQQATVVEAVPTSEVTESANAPEVQMPAEETAPKN